MIKLKEFLSVNGTGIPNLKAALVERTDDKAIYLRSDGVYEVFIIKVQEEGYVFDTYYMEREVYPSSEDFGNTAWTYRNLHSAMNKYKTL